MSELLQSYRNGNYDVSIYSDGTKIRSYDQEPLKPEFPESMDVKITNYCDNPNCVTFCHEKSNLLGQHADLESLLPIFNELPSGIEVALGGGNPLSHPKLNLLLKELKGKEIISNLTVNQFHLNQSDFLSQVNDYIKSDLIKGIGVSYIKNIPINIINGLNNTKNLIWHLIMGIHTLEDLRNITNQYPQSKVLLLGYKKYGNGLSYHNRNTNIIDFELKRWFRELYTFFKSSGLTISFDNLAIKQLNLKRFFCDDNDWNSFYMGDDGSTTFYLDLVKKEYAVSSTSQQRFPIVGNIKNMFTHIKSI